MILIDEEDEEQQDDEQVDDGKDARRKARELRKAQLLDKQRKNYSDLSNQKIKLAQHGEYGTGKIDGTHKLKLNVALGLAGDDA